MKWGIEIIVDRVNVCVAFNNQELQAFPWTFFGSNVERCPKILTTLTRDLEDKNLTMPRGVYYIAQSQNFIKDY